MQSGSHWKTTRPSFGDLCVHVGSILILGPSPTNKPEKGNDMPIPSTEALLIKAELKADFFRDAFIALAVEFQKCDKQRFDRSASAIKNMLHQFPANKYHGLAHTSGRKEDFEEVQKNGLGEALVAFDKATAVAKNRFKQG